MQEADAPLEFDHFKVFKETQRQKSVFFFRISFPRIIISVESNTHLRRGDQLWSEGERTVTRARQAQRLAETSVTFGSCPS